MSEEEYRLDCLARYINSHPSFAARIRTSKKWPEERKADMRERVARIRKEQRA